MSTVGVEVAEFSKAWMWLARTLKGEGVKSTLRLGVMLGVVLKLADVNVSVNGKQSRVLRHCIDTGGCSYMLLHVYNTQRQKQCIHWKTRRELLRSRGLGWDRFKAFARFTSQSVNNYNISLL